MAQVPYSPVPDIAPQVPGPARVGIDTPPAAFGAATAAATRQLGQQGEQSGNEMFQTYLYSKQLENDTGAKNDFVNASGRIAEVENKLYGLKGQEAVDFAPIAQQQIQQIYRDSIANAPNPQWGRMLGDQLSRRVAYSTIDIGRHSGQEKLRAAGDASASVVAVGLDLISKNPWNEDQFQKYVGDGGIIDQEAVNLDRLGFGKAEANKIKLKNQAWEARFESLYAKPDQALALYNQHEKEIPPAAQANIVRQIKSAESTAKFIATYSDALDKAQAEKDINEISARNRIVTPDGQAGYKPEAIAQITRYIQQNPGADKIGEERIGWMRRANEDAAKGVVAQTDWNDPSVTGLTANMFDATNPTSERDVAKVENARKIGPKDRDWILNTIKLRDGSDKEALARPDFKLANDTAKLWLEGSTAGEKKFNAGRYMAFQSQFLSAYLSAVNDKSLKPDDLDIKNTKGMFRQLVDAFRPGIANGIRGAGGVAPPVQPAVPETPLGSEQNPYHVLTREDKDKLPNGAHYTRPDAPGSVFLKGDKPSKKPEVNM